MARVGTTSPYQSLINLLSNGPVPAQLAAGSCCTGTVEVPAREEGLACVEGLAGSVSRTDVPARSLACGTGAVPHRGTTKAAPTLAESRGSFPDTALALQGAPRAQQGSPGGGFPLSQKDTVMTMANLSSGVAGML